jgi:hypothetical protein
MSRADDRIQAFNHNPFYWQYKGEPVVLLGGSVQDNLFQISGLEDELNCLASVGGNYVRCTMSSRDEGDVWPFERVEDGRYDLEKPGAAYWQRFERFLALTADRDVIVQIELWDRFDFARDPWQRNPYNPKNNVNYTAEESGLRQRIDAHPGERENAFFRTVPALENNERVLRVQQAQLDELLGRSLPYGQVLYCIDNETNESPEWPAYWADRLRERAAEAGVGVEVTEMWDPHDLRHPQHAHTFDHPDLYSFVDISQNNHQDARTHWENAQYVRGRLLESGRPRPMNSVKVYGANTGRFGTGRDGQERFWRNLFAGLAAVRFHRPPSGLGLGETARKHIRSARMLTGVTDLFACEPHNDLLAERSWNEAYCLAHPGAAYTVFFPDGGDVRLDVSAVAGTTLRIRWLDVLKAGWLTPTDASAEGVLRLVTPREEGYWVAVVEAVG